VTRLIATIPSPSRLVTPEDLAGAATDAAPWPWWWTVALGAVLIAALALAAVVMRRRRGCPRERAFARLCRKQGYSRSRIARLRQTARAEGLSSPLAMLVCPESMRARRVANNDHAGVLGIALPGRSHSTRSHAA